MEEKRSPSSGARIAIVLTFFACASLSVGLLLGAGVSRSGPDERPAMALAALAIFAALLVAGAVIGLLRPAWRRSSEDLPAWAAVLAWTMFAAAFVGGLVLDLVAD